VVSCEVRPNTSRGAQHSRFILQLSGSDAKKVKKTAENIRDMVVNHPSAEGSVHIHSDVSPLPTCPHLCISFFLLFLAWSCGD
jgi:hypothetical protein